MSPQEILSFLLISVNSTVETLEIENGEEVFFLVLGLLGCCHGRWQKNFEELRRLRQEEKNGEHSKWEPQNQECSVCFRNG